MFAAPFMSHSAEASCRVLLVEDDPDTCDVMARLISRNTGCEVRCCKTVAEAIAFWPPGS
jgi:CheY-like chemotaxis protein